MIEKEQASRGVDGQPQAGPPAGSTAAGNEHIQALLKIGTGAVLTDHEMNVVHGWADRTMCAAGEWHRDGRGLWAERRCRYYRGHGLEHDFGSWRYDVAPPAGDGHQPPSSDAVDPHAPRTVDGPTRDVESVTQHDALVQQRDELLKVLKMARFYVVRYIKHDYINGDFAPPELEQIDAAIQHAEVTHG